MLDPGTARTDVVLIEPPFAAINRPSLGLHLLQAIATREGISVSVQYENLHLAAEFGEAAYQELCFLPTGFLVGERIFAHTAFGGNPRRLPDKAFEDKEAIRETSLKIRGKAHDVVRATARRAVTTGARIIGCTTTFEQTSFGLAVLKEVKAICPEVYTLLGGANCENPMGSAIFDISGWVDYVFSGESEASFPLVLKQILSGHPPKRKVVFGEPCMSLDALPICRFDEYFQQLEELLPNSRMAKDNHIRVPMETSRGCWWGQKHHCTFCGLNGEGMSFRQKSAKRAFDELISITRNVPVSKVFMTDNIMPHDYFSSLLKILSKNCPTVYIFYEQKSNLSLQNFKDLRNASVMEIQPGIEALSSPLLVRMKKGVRASMNIRTLRYARSFGITVSWNLLCGFPGDTVDEYAHLPSLLPLLSHLQPPGHFGHISIDRFSPYFVDFESYGLENLRPIRSYGEVYPSEANLFDLAYHFEADYASAITEDKALFKSIASLIEDWETKWSGDIYPPCLFVSDIDGDQFILVDTREGTRGLAMRFISRERAQTVLWRPASDADRKWALDIDAAVMLEGEYVPLATSTEGVLEALTDARRAFLSEAI